jgi:biopolymer transport protein ExbD
VATLCFLASAVRASDAAAPTSSPAANSVLLDVRPPSAPDKTAPEVDSPGKWPTVVVDGREFPIITFDDQGHPTAKRPLHELLTTLDHQDRKLKVVLRVDPQLHYQYLAQVLVSCAEAGIRDVSCHVPRQLKEVPEDTGQDVAEQFKQQQARRAADERAAAVMLKGIAPAVQGGNGNQDPSHPVVLEIRVDSMKRSMTEAPDPNDPNPDPFMASFAGERGSYTDTHSLQTELVKKRAQFEAQGTALDKIQVVLNPNRYTKFKNLILVHYAVVNAGFTEVGFSPAH